MIHSNTSFGKLKEVIVGRELEIDQRVSDLTFRLFYKENLKQDIYQSYASNYSISHDLLLQRNKELDDLAKILQQLGVKVHRPKKLDKVLKIQTPYFKSECSSASNVRDITLVYKDKIIETPVAIRNRYFENMLLYNVYSNAYENGKGGQWIKAPNTFLTEQTIDLDDWKDNRDFSNVPSSMQMAIDGAQFLRIGKDVIVNVSTYNHMLGLNWIKSFFPDTDFHIVKIADNHIDGALLCLKSGVFLAHPKYVDDIKIQMPDKFKHWKYIIPEKLTHITTNTQLASSEGIDINVLSIDEHTVLVNKRATSVVKLLEDEKFDVIPIELNNCELFAGGIHCSTLDLVREDEFISYA